MLLGSILALTALLTVYPNHVSILKLAFSSVVIIGIMALFRYLRPKDMPEFKEIYLRMLAACGLLLTASPMHVRRYNPLKFSWTEGLLCAIGLVIFAYVINERRRERVAG